MRFVDNQSIPLDCGELGKVVSYQHFGSSDENIDHPSSFPFGCVPLVALLQILAVHGDRVRLIFGVWHFEFSNIVSILGRAVINDRIEIGPARKLSVPVRDRRERGHDEKGTRSP